MHATLTPPTDHTVDDSPTTSNLTWQRTTGAVHLDGNHAHTNLTGHLGHVAPINDQTWVWVTLADTYATAGTTNTLHLALEELLDAPTTGDTLTEVVRGIFRTETDLGAWLFRLSWVGFAVWFGPHIVKLNAWRKQRAEEDPS